MSEHRKLAADLLLELVVGVLGILTIAVWSPRMSFLVYLAVGGVIAYGLLLVCMVLLGRWMHHVDEAANDIFRRYQDEKQAAENAAPLSSAVTVVISPADGDMTQWQDCRITGSPWRNR